MRLTCYCFVNLLNASTRLNLTKIFYLQQFISNIEIYIKIPFINCICDLFASIQNNSFQLKKTSKFLKYNSMKDFIQILLKYELYRIYRSGIFFKLFVNIHCSMNEWMNVFWNLKYNKVSTKKRKSFFPWMEES